MAQAVCVSVHVGMHAKKEGWMDVHLKDVNTYTST